MKARLAIHRADGKQDEVPVIVRVDTSIEVEHYKGGGILQYVLRQTLSRA
jgi:aconitate hydratase